VATNTPFNDRRAVHTKQAPYRTYVIAGAVPRGAVTPALFWTTGDPYHYVRLAAGTATADLLVVGGLDHKTGQNDDASERYARLEQWARKHVPAFGAVQYRWSGQIMEPVDSLAFIGRNPGDSSSVYVVTGDSGNGMTHGAIAGLLLAGLIREGSHPWAELYDPARRNMRAAYEFARENLNAAAQYADWIGRGDVESTASIEAGSGAVVRRGASRVAVFRDERGVTHEMSAVCPHLGGIVSWNSAERSWDCPCHGSRFDALGGLLNGPANEDLAPAHEPVGPIGEAVAEG
jgi:nitrite reductase/ring-hydroxylating ferredoxin subunit